MTRRRQCTLCGAVGGLADLFGVDVAEIEAAAERGELPKGFGIFGERAWTGGMLADHFEERACSRKKGT